MKYFIVIVILIVAGFYFFLPNETHVEDNVRSEEINIEDIYFIEGNSAISWNGAKIVGLSHDGKIPVKSGEVSDSSGEIVFDVSLIESDSNMLTGHLKSEDFFNVEMYPEAKLFIKSITSNQIVGDLTIKDVTKEIDIPVELTVGEVLTIKGQTTIDRTDFGINYKSGSIFQELGDGAISDDVEIVFDLTFRK